MAFFTAKGLLRHGSVKLLGSPSFWGKLLRMIAEHSSLILTEEATFSRFSLCERSVGQASLYSFRMEYLFEHEVGKLNLKREVIIIDISPGILCSIRRILRVVLSSFFGPVGSFAVFTNKTQALAMDSSTLCLNRRIRSLRDKRCQKLDAVVVGLQQEVLQLPRGTENIKKGKGGPEWVVRSLFEDELSNFMLKKKFHVKGIERCLTNTVRKYMNNSPKSYPQSGKEKFLNQEALTFAITTRSGVSTRDPPFPTPSQSTPANYAKGATEKGPRGVESSIIQDEESPGNRLEYYGHKGDQIIRLYSLKILMEDEFKPSVQPQRRVNPNIEEVVNKEVIKLLDAGLIYLVFDSPWMPERLAGHEYYFFLDGFSGYFHIPIALEDQEKTRFTCANDTFTYKRMPFGLCNTPATFQRCMTVFFHELVEDSMEVFMDDFSVFGSSFDHYLENLEKMLKSDYAMGAVLGQRINKHFKPIHYANKMMNEAQENYTTSKKELLAIIFTFNKFRQDLVLSKTIVFTNLSALRVLTESYEGVSPEMRQHKSFDNVIVAHQEGIMMEQARKRYGVIHRFYITYRPQINGQAIKNCNMDLTKAGENQFLQINELDKMRRDAYESSISYKERTKRWHDKQIKTPTNYEKGDKILLFNSCLRLFLKKLKSRWYRPFSVSKDMKNGAIELYDEDGNEFIINQQLVKPYQKDVLEGDINDDITLDDEGEVT
nr:reverse transcriptase domain-containing protein [Tanacetum cinerariifolium]